MSHYYVAGHDTLVDGQVATCITLHGRQHHLTRVIAAIETSRWQVLVVKDPTAAADCVGYHDAYVIIAGHLDPAELNAILACLGGAPLLPPPSPN